jgi:8-oxo-dGTP diphosphatase
MSNHPPFAVTADIVLISSAGERAILLIERGGEPFRGCLALPGGFVEPDESLIDAAQRELAEETGIEGIELRQLAAFGAPDRDPRMRVVSVAHVAVIDTRPDPVAASDASSARWVPVSELSEADLAFDHAEIIAAALARIDRQAD